MTFMLCTATTLVETPSSSMAYASSCTPVSALSIMQLSHTQSSAQIAGAEAEDTTVEEELERDPNVTSSHVRKLNGAST